MPPLRNNTTNKLCTDLFHEQIQISCWQWIIIIIIISKDVEHTEDAADEDEVDEDEEEPTDEG